MTIRTFSSCPVVVVPNYNCLYKRQHCVLRKYNIFIILLGIIIICSIQYNSPCSSLPAKNIKMENIFRKSFTRRTDGAANEHARATFGAENRNHRSPRAISLTSCRDNAAAWPFGSKRGYVRPPSTALVVCPADNRRTYSVLACIYYYYYYFHSFLIIAMSITSGLSMFAYPPPTDNTEDTTPTSYYYLIIAAAVETLFNF